MIRRSPVGVSASLTMAIDSAAVNYDSLMSVEVDLKENAHDVCTFVMSGVPSRAITDYIGKPVYIQMDSGATFVTHFYGTVELALPTATTAAGKMNGSLFQEVQFTCMGVSYKMRSVSHRVWEDYTLVDVATSIADTYRMSLSMPNDLTVFGTAMQNESDWKFLLGTVQHLGYAITAQGAHLHIYDPHKAAVRQPSLHRFSAPPRDSPAPMPGQIVNFGGTFTRTSADGKYADAVAFIHDDAGNTFNLTTSEMMGLTAAPIRKDVAHLTVDNYLEAERVLRAAARSEYDYKAEVTTLGAAGVVPGGVADIDSYDAEFDGLWYVAGVKHILRSGSFLTVSDIRRNRNDPLVESSVGMFKTPPPTVLISGEWVSKVRTVDVYAP